MKKSFLILLSICCLIGCEEKIDETKDLVVSVGGEHLYLEDFEEIIPAQSSKDDSMKLVDHHVDSWIKETLFRLEAEKKADKIDLEELVNDYRNSLLVHNYENILIQENLDTVISAKEISDTYQELKFDFILAEPAYLVFSMVIPESDRKEFADLWGDDEFKILDSMCKIKKYEHQILDSVWLTKTQIVESIPQKISNKMRYDKGYYTATKIDTMRYFVEVMSTLKQGKESPQSVVEKQLRKLILHKRTRHMLEKEKSELYQNAMSNSSMIKYADN